MSSLSTARHDPPAALRWTLLVLFLSALLLVGCGEAREGAQGTPTAQPRGEISVPLPTFVAELKAPIVDLTIHQDEVLVEPVPLRAGFPFTVTALIHNNLRVPAEDIPVMILISAEQEEIGYTSYTQLITVTVPASQSLQVDLPVDWNFAGGEHRLWIQANRLPDAWQERAPTKSEANTQDNIALVDLIVDPFDAYTSDLCSGRVDVKIGPEDILPEPDQQRVLVRLHNVGNRCSVQSASCRDQCECDGNRLHACDSTLWGHSRGVGQSGSSLSGGRSADRAGKPQPVGGRAVGG